MMKNIPVKVLFFLLVSGLFLFTFGQLRQNSDGKFTYYTADNDPLKARIYKLDNGLTVYLTDYKNEPRLQTFIVVKAGSKNDPADATGLAHYLEHMLFKGTDKFGTKDFTKEKPLIDEIINLYEDYRKTTDAAKRKIIYHMIDSVSGLASKYAIPNEYDKMMSIVGAKGTNAFTSNEQTAYVNDIPSNEMERWLMIESERFRNPVMRLFHTELEAVYEEKNISLDDDGDKAWYALFENVFPTHQYGTQTTIGTIQHLKNPSIQKVINYYNTYYVPNNMAICISGDIDYSNTIELINKYFGSFQSKTVPEFIPALEKPITKPVIKEVYGQDADFVIMGFRFPGQNTPEGDMLTMVDNILSNSSVGLLDLNLNQSQKVLGSSSSAIFMKDYSVHYFGGNPRKGQSLEEVKNLMLEQIEKVKKGDFPDWMPEAIVNNMRLDEIKNNESNRRRAGSMMNSFVKNIPWDTYIEKTARLSKITKKEIMEFAQKYYKNNYVVIYKRTGEDKNVVKVDKPVITPVDLNRQDKSDFLNSVSEFQSSDIQPVFIDYKTDLQESKIKNDIPLYYKKNEENELFNINIVIDYGDHNNKMLPVAVDYFTYLGTSKYSPSQLQQEFFKLGCSYGLTSSEDQATLSLSGLNDNFDKALSLFKEILTDLKPNKEALDNLVQDILKSRADAKLNKETILWDALFSYGKYGSNSPYKYELSESELKELKPDDLISLISSLPSFRQKVLYYGPYSSQQITEKLNGSYMTSAAGLQAPSESFKFAELPTSENTVLVANYEGMVQAEIIFLSKKDFYEKDKVPYISMFNEYFGSGMSGMVFQEIRESKALAYGVFSSYTTPPRNDRSHYSLAYIGTQADKLPEAMQSMMDLLNNMPESELSFASAKNNLLQKINTERITKSAILTSYLNAQKLGLDYDIRKDVYDKVKTMTLADVKKFQEENVKNLKYTILILGDKNKLDEATLAKYGTVKYLTLEEIFGY